MYSWTLLQEIATSQSNSKNMLLIIQKYVESKDKIDSKWGGIVSKSGRNKNVGRFFFDNLMIELSNILPPMRTVAGFGFFPQKFCSVVSGRAV